MGLTVAKAIAGVKGTLEGVTGIGLVYDRRRMVKNEQDAALLWRHGPSNRIHAWNVTLDQEEPVSAARMPGFSRTTAGPIFTTITLAVEGVYGVVDADDSETEFRNLVELVQLTFNSIGLLSNVGGLVDGDVHDQGAMQWRRWGYQVLASMYTVHYARLVLSLTGRV